MKQYRIIFSGYGPENTSFSKSLKLMGDKIAKQFPELVDVQYVYNVMELGYKSEDILWMTEQGILTVTYQSTSYLTDDVPELAFVDLPFLFRDNAHARNAMDGKLGQYLTNKIEDRKNYKIRRYDSCNYIVPLRFFFTSLTSPLFCIFGKGPPFE